MKLSYFLKEILGILNQIYSHVTLTIFEIFNTPLLSVHVFYELHLKTQFSLLSQPIFHVEKKVKSV